MTHIWNTWNQTDEPPGLPGSSFPELFLLGEPIIHLFFHILLWHLCCSAKPMVSIFICARSRVHTLSHMDWNHPNCISLPEYIANPSCSSVWQGQIEAASDSCSSLLLWEMELHIYIYSFYYFDWSSRLPGRFFFMVRVLCIFWSFTEKDWRKSCLKVQK